MIKVPIRCACGKQFAKSGFGLIEILIALAILIVAVLAFGVLFTSSHNSIFAAGRQKQALYTAQSSMELRVSQGAAISSTDALVITVTGLAPITVNGEMYSIAIAGQSARLSTFIPRR
ncbi:MAG: type II secretion system protein [Dethiobacter sp.]|nr:type II secretion system protein [Dethiobacter sp.]